MRVAAIVFGLALCLVPAAHAQKHDPTRTVVVFGGFGYFDKESHRWLTDLLERREGLVKQGQSLERDVRAAAAATFAVPLRGWSSHKLVFNPEDLGAAFNAATKTQERVSDTGRMLAAFDRVLVVVLTGGFEHAAAQKVSLTGGRQIYHPYVFARVSASLLDNATGSILLSTSALSMVAPGALYTDPGQAWGDHFLAAYTEGARKALTQIRSLAETTKPGDTDDFKDVYAVTGAVVASSSTAAALAAREFDWKSAGSAQNVSQEIGKACKPVTFCADGSGACRAMTGLLVAAVSESLSNGGHRVLPPVTWGDELLKADGILRYRLSLPAEGLSGMMPMTNIAFDAKRATKKTVAVLAGIDLTSKPDDDGVNAWDTYSASVNAHVFQTDPRDCTTLSSSVFRKQDAKGSAPADRRPAASGFPELSARQLEFLRAIHRAAAGLTSR